MTTVAIIGVWGNLGRLLVDRFGDDPEISRIVGVDIDEGDGVAPNLEFYRLDARSSALREVLDGVDIAIHLPSSYADLATAVATARRVREAVEAGDVGRVIVRSSTLVYGAHPDSQAPLTEETPVRPIPSSEGPAAVWAAVEAEYAGLEGLTVLRLAPAAWSSGPIVSVLQSGALPVVDGYNPRIQLLHPQDAVGAFEFVVGTDVQGVFNVAPASGSPLSELLKAWGRRTVKTSPVDAEETAAKLARSGVMNPGEWILPFLMYDWEADGSKFAAEGWNPSRHTSETLELAMEAAGSKFSVGPIAFRPRDVIVAAVGAAAVLGSLVARKRNRT